MKKFDEEYYERYGYQCYFCGNEGLDSSDMVNRDSKVWEFDKDDYYCPLIIRCCKECLETDEDAQVYIDGYKWSDMIIDE